MTAHTGTPINHSHASVIIDELYDANAFLSPGENSRAELIPSPQAHARSRWLAENLQVFLEKEPSSKTIETYQLLIKETLLVCILSAKENLNFTIVVEILLFWQTKSSLV